MREIMFRQPLLNPDGSFNKFHYWGIMPDGFDGRDMSGCKKGDDQQYIGIMDCEGQKIFEGDKIKGFVDYLDVYIIGECRWDAESAGFDVGPVMVREFEVFYLLDELDNIRVIGNNWEGDNGKA